MADLTALRHNAKDRVRTTGEVPSIAIMIVSAGPSEGKTTTAANLAAAFADAGARVLVLSCDWQRPAIERMLRDGEDARLENVPADADELNDAALQTTVPGVGVVPHIVGPDTPGQRAEVGRKLVNMAREIADVVIIDTAPMLATNDASELAAQVDLLVLTARSGYTHTSAASGVREILAQLHAPVSGVVVVGSHPAPLGLRYYKYYRSYSKPEDKGRRRGRRHREEEHAPSERSASLDA
jgi:Mrp family chromosome partitioning ATPase